MSKDTLSNHLAFDVSRSSTTGNNVLSVMYVENSTNSLLKEVTLQDGVLSGAVFDEDTSTLVLKFNSTDPSHADVSVDLSILKDVYEAGYGIDIDGLSINVDPHQLPPFATTFHFEDNTVSTFNFVGELGISTLIDAGLRDNETTWNSTPTSIVVGRNVTAIVDKAFQNSNGHLTSVTIPDTVSCIGNRAFSNNTTTLAYVNIPNSVKVIGANAFDSCNGLSNLFIPASVSSIAQDAFNALFESSAQHIFFKDRAFDQITSLPNYGDWGNNAGSICAWHDASQEWVIENMSSEADTDKLNSTAVAPAFDETSAYAVDDYVTYEGNLYKAISAHSAGSWSSDDFASVDMTEPEATLNIDEQNQTLQVVSSDGSIIWDELDNLRYSLLSAQSIQLVDRAINTYVLSTLSVEFVMPDAVPGKAVDFIVDVSGSYSPSATVSFKDLDTNYAMVVRDGDSLADMTTVLSGEMARFLVTQTGFAILSGKPTYMLMKNVVVNGGAES